MKCEMCGGDLTPMIYSWFCKKCDEKNAIAQEKQPQQKLKLKKFVRSTIGRIGYNRIGIDDDLIDEDPDDDDEPDYYHP